jgi:hypothetical protein
MGYYQQPVDKLISDCQMIRAVGPEALERLQSRKANFGAEVGNAAAVPEH